MPNRILVADDETSSRKTRTSGLEGEGYTVTAGSNYEEALAENARRAGDLAGVGGEQFRRFHQHADAFRPYPAAGECGDRHSIVGIGSRRRQNSYASGSA